MAIQILQKPSDIQPAQSPVVFSVVEANNSYTASEFQYTANLYIWNGNQTNSGSYLYQARKYPNVSGSGIFDFSRFINSTLTNLVAENSSSIKYYKAEFGWQFASGSTYVTQSGGLTPSTCSIGGTLFKAYDGYSLFPEQINTSLYSQNDYWPFMTDMGSVTQSVLITDTTKVNSTAVGLPIWTGRNDNTYPTSIAITASYNNGTISTASTTVPTASTTTSLQINHLPAAPGDSNWGTYWPTTTNLNKYSFTAYSGSTVLSTLSYEVVDECYYNPVRLAYKNRYGQLDFINFYKRSNQQFNTDQRLFQPQLGTWASQTLSYNQFQTRQQRYIVDASEILEVNSDWLEEGYNDIFKQILVSDEIYWLYDQTNNIVKPLSIVTNTLAFKTHINNKLIQYSLTFNIGQPFKLIL